MPTLGLAEIYFMRFSYVAEHYLTFAMIGFIYPVVKILGNKKYGNWLVIVFTIGLFLTSADYINFYASEKIVMNHSLSKNPDSFLPHNILGLAYKNENNLDIAIYHFNKSNVINPNAASYYNIASINEKNNDLNNAVINYKKSIDLNPYVANTYNNLAIIYSKLKNKTEAINHFKQALKTDPGDIRFYYNIGFAHEENNELELAIAWYQRALVLQPTNELIQKSLNRIVKK
jgi:tetratricopeptide (TPR) repeat protein